MLARAALRSLSRTAAALPARPVTATMGPMCAQPMWTRTIASTASVIPLYTTRTLPTMPPPSSAMEAANGVPAESIVSQAKNTSGLPSDIQEAARLLKEQGKQYVVVEIAGRSFLVTKNDLVVVDRLRGTQVGDVLELDRVRELGTMDYTLYGKPLVDSRMVRVRATVIEEPKSSQIITLKFKKRKHYHRRLRNRHHYTILRISDVEVLAV